MKATELAAKIERVEGVKVCIVAPEDVEFDDYRYERKAKGNMSVTGLKNDRLAKAAKGYSVEVFDKNNAPVHGRTLLSNLR